MAKKTRRATLRKTSKTVSVEDQAESGAPEVSPYCSPPFRLNIGPNEVSYYVAQPYICQYPKLESERGGLSDSWGTNIQLPDIDEDIGHTLVHFLYTGEYQTLSPLAVLDNAIEYKRSIRIYCVARGYELDDLVEHAKSKMRELEEGLSIFSILDIAVEMLPKLLPDETWFFECIEDIILEAFKKEQSLFTDERFLDCMGKDVTFDKFLVKSIVKVYTSKISSPVRKEEEPSSTIPQPAPMVEPADVPETKNVAALEPTPGIELSPIDKVPIIEPESIEELLLSQGAGPGPESIPEPAAPESVLKSASESDPKPTPELDSECGLSIEKASIQEPVSASQHSFDHWAEGSGLSQIEMQKPVDERPQIPKSAYRRLVVPPPAIFTHPGIIQLEDSSEDEEEKECAPVVPDAELTKDTSVEALPAPEKKKPQSPSLADFELQSETPTSPRQANEPDKEPEAEMSAMENIICPFRVIHLLEGDMWRNCRSCRAVINQVAFQLTRKENFGGDEYEKVDEILVSQPEKGPQPSSSFE